MSYIDATKNQHYLSQVEQRLNSIPGKGKKIYSFVLKDREKCTVELENVNGIGIQSNLSFIDLYTFEFLDEGMRKNFESAFGVYESKIGSATSALLDKIKANDENILEELNDVLRLKFLNFIRNPYNIKKVLNSIGVLADHHPSQEQLLEEYRLLEKRNDGGIERICRDFDVTREQYLNWMKVIFLSLIDVGGGETILEHLVRELFENKGLGTAATIYGISDAHPDKKVVLSDRSYVDYSAAADGNLMMAFNLNANYFIKFAILDVTRFMEAKAPAGMDKEKVMEAFLKLNKNVNVYVQEDNEEALSQLAGYNMNAVYQCHSKVFCSIPSIYMG
jgi:hypothetical protein